MPEQTLNAAVRKLMESRMTLDISNEKRDAINTFHRDTARDYSLAKNELVEILKPMPVWSVLEIESDGDYNYVYVNKTFSKCIELAENAPEGRERLVHLLLTG